MPRSLRTQIFSSTCLIYYTLRAANIQKELQGKKYSIILSSYSFESIAGIITLFVLLNKAEELEINVFLRTRITPGI